MQILRVLAGVLLIAYLGVASSCTPVGSLLHPRVTALPSPAVAPTAPPPPAPAPVQTAAPSVAPAPQFAPASGGSGWRRVFSDEFGTASLDRLKWTDCYWWDDDGCTNLGNENLQWYRPSNISLQDGALALTAREQSVRGIEDRSFRYTSGIVTTGRYYSERARPDRFSFTYGYVEVRARIPSGQGLWPAIWLLPSTHRSLPEIDIMEVLGHRPNVLEMHLHYTDGAGERSKVNRAVTVGDLSQGMHTYGLEWSPEAIIWYLDGVERWRVSNSAIIPREPMYLIVNLAVGGTWPGSPDAATAFPAQFLVDYVRIWQRG